MWKTRRHLNDCSGGPITSVALASVPEASGLDGGELNPVGRALAVRSPARLDHDQSRGDADAGAGQGIRRARIAHISDLHCSPFVLESYLRRCVAAVNRLVPDFVVITGDFITGGRSHARGVAGVLAGLRPTVGTLAVMGNHDYGIIHPSGRAVGGLADYLQDQLSLEADIFVLRNEIHTFRRGSSAIQFIGLDDYWTQFDPRTAFERRDGAVPAVALCHNPDATPQLLRQGVPWILSGHTHGKVTPNFAMLDRLMPMEQRNLVAGHYRLGQDQNLYVNRGLGHAWRMRACDRPEITLLTLRRSESLAAQAA